MPISTLRTIVVPGANPTLNAAVIAPALRWPIAEPAASLDYSLDLGGPGPVLTWDSGPALTLDFSNASSSGFIALF